MAKLNSQILATDPVLGEMVHRLVDSLHPEQIYLFGSRARSEATPESDYDLMIIVPTATLPSYRRNQLAFRVLCGIPTSKGVIVVTRQEFEQKKNVVCSLPATVLREGKILYEA
jgi:uncharacterized protein